LLEIDEHPVERLPADDDAAPAEKELVVFADRAVSLFAQQLVAIQRVVVTKLGITANADLLVPALPDRDIAHAAAFLQRLFLPLFLLSLQLHPLIDRDLLVLQQHVFQTPAESFRPPPAEGREDAHAAPCPHPHRSPHPPPFSHVVVRSETGE
jgi:hypothetical protein